MGDDSKNQIFHSSNIANQTLAGSTSDPFTLTEKEKKRQQKQAARLEKQTKKNARKIKKKMQRTVRCTRLKEWRKKHRLLSMTIFLSLTLVLGFGCFMLGNALIHLLNQKPPLAPSQVRASIDQNDPISVSCQCEKNSALYNEVKKTFEEDLKTQQELAQTFDLKTATPHQTSQFIDQIIGVDVTKDATDTTGNVDLEKALANINRKIEAAKITDESQKRLFKIYSYRAYIAAKKYSQAIEELIRGYRVDELYNGEKAIYYGILIDAYYYLGNTTEQQAAIDAYRAIPDDPDSF